MTAPPQSVYRRAAEKFAGRLARDLPEVQAVVLYGSVARGDADEESDTDIMVLVEKEDQALERCITEIAQQLWEPGVLLQVIVEDLPFFRRGLEWGSPLQRTIVRMGVPLFDRGVFAELRAALTRVREERSSYKPSRELLDSYLERADEALSEARTLLGTRSFDGASSRAYYAMFNAASAAVLMTGIEEIRSHKALVDLFRLKVCRERGVELDYAADLEQAFTLRLRADYEPRFRLDETTARDAVAKAERFIARMREFLARPIDGEGTD